MGMIDLSNNCDKREFNGATENNEKEMKNKNTHKFNYRIKLRAFVVVDPVTSCYTRMIPQ
jgi:ABC-type transporter lipoprotein component MlaA